MNTKLLRVLNIRAEESALVSRLFLVQFFLISGSSFLFVIANAIFLSVFPISQLPLVFFITGLFLFLFNKIYHRAEHIFSTKRMLFGVIIFSVVITILIRFFMSFPQLTWMPYVLLVWYNLVYLLTGLVFWGLAASIFNVRESKRLFTIIGAGDIPAKLIGYLSVPLLAPFFGLTNMIWVAVILFAGAFIFSGKIFESARVKNISHHEVHHQHLKPKKQSGNKLITAIAILSLLTFCALMLIDFIFLAEVKVKYHTDLELAYFLGLFFAGGRILAAFIKFTLSSRLINIAGLAGSLLISPILLIAFTIFILASESISGNHVLLYLFGIMALLTEILKTTIQEPIFLVLFQPLKLSLRLRGHIIAKGYMLASALTISGALLYVFVEQGKMHSGNFLLMVLMVLLALWIISIFLVKKEYVLTLKEALQRGFLSGNDLFLEDRATMDLLISRAHSANPQEVIFALDLLEKANYKEFNSLLFQKLDSKDHAIISFVLSKIAERNITSRIEDLVKKLHHTNDVVFASQLIQTIVALTDSHPVLKEYINSDQPELQAVALAGMLKSEHADFRQTAFYKIEELVLLKEKAANIRVADIIYQSGDGAFTGMLKDLLNDADEDVVKAAMKATESLPAKELLPILVEKLNDPIYTRTAIAAITNFQNTAIEFFEENTSCCAPHHLIKIAGNINTERSYKFLQAMLFDNPAQGSLIVDELYKSTFETDESYREKYYDLAKTRLDEAEKIFHLKNTFDNEEKVQQCKKALDSEVNARLMDALKLLSIANGHGKVSAAIHVIITRQHQKISNALEMLELSIPREIFQKINRLAEQKQKRIHAREHDKPTLQILKEIVESKSILYNEWTRAIAMQMAATLNPQEFQRFLADRHFTCSPILDETRNFILTNPKI